jgi:hypothetical protein
MTESSESSPNLTCPTLTYLEMGERRSPDPAIHGLSPRESISLFGKGFDPGRTVGDRGQVSDCLPELLARAPHLFRGCVPGSKILRWNAVLTESAA